MTLGDLEFHVLCAGRLLLDGGAMFGVIPRTIWEKKMRPDVRNRITLSMNCLLIRAAGKRILVETGAGDKMNPKLCNIYGLEAKPVVASLRDYGVSPEDIDIVINTHLHFDHCGGNTRREGHAVVPTFPNARYVVEKGELEHALHPTERDRASYFVENFEPIARAGRFNLIEGTDMIAPGVECVHVPGHTANMVCVRLTGGGQTAFFFADLVPTTVHLPLPWIMGYDLYPMTTLENKKRWIPAAIREGWLALFAHDAATPAGYLRAKDGEWVVEPVHLD